MKKRKKKKIPPKTMRYCFNCEKKTKFKFDRIIGHSYCSECGKGSNFAGKIEK